MAKLHVDVDDKMEHLSPLLTHEALIARDSVPTDQTEDDQVVTTAVLTVGIDQMEFCRR